MADVIENGEQKEVENEAPENGEELQEQEGNEGHEADAEKAEEGQEVDDEAEFWQNVENEEPEAVSVQTHLRIKQKLKGRISERDERIEALEKRIAEYENGGKITPSLSKRPRQEDFDDDDQYEAALDQYDQQRLQSVATKSQQLELARKEKEQRQHAVDNHYQRADEFVGKYAIAPEKYKKADESVRKAVDTVFPNQGDTIADQLISILGEGSEKVFFRVGAKPELLHHFQSLLLEDKSGIKAGVFLGRQMEFITNPKKRTSRAPKPAPQINGDAAGGSSAKAMKKRYNEAHSKGDTQKAFNLKRSAKKAGYDVSEW